MKTETKKSNSMNSESKMRYINHYQKVNFLFLIIHTIILDKFERVLMTNASAPPTVVILTF